MSEKDYSTVEIVVEINSACETMSLYNEYRAEGWTYQQDMGGPLITIGSIVGRPICIAPLIHTIGGVKVMYVEATSPLVDWDMIEHWITSKVNKGVRIINDPINLYNAIRSKMNE